MPPRAIRGAILDELRRMDWCPRRARARARKLKEAINALEQRLGRPASEPEICDELGLTPKEYAKWLDESRPVTFIAIDQTAETEDSDGASLHELLADSSDVTGREKMEKEELLQLLAQRIAELPDIPRKILAMYYFENMRLAEIAQVFGLTESRICQIHSQTILGLRAYLGRVARPLALPAGHAHPRRRPHRHLLRPSAVSCSPGASRWCWRTSRSLSSSSAWPWASWSSPAPATS